MIEELDLYGLVYECPNGRRKDSCPFKEIEMLSFRGKVEWIKKLRDTDKKSICVHHESCFYGKDDKSDDYLLFPKL